MKLTIDRFEGEYVLLELPDRKMISLPRLLVPGAKEGDVIEISIDRKATEDRKRNIKKLMDELWEE